MGERSRSRSPQRSTRKAAKAQPKLFQEPAPEFDDIRRELQAILDLLK